MCLKPLFGRTGFYFDQDSGGAGGGSETPAENQPPAPQKNDQKPPNAGDNSGKQLTQEQLDAKFAERASRATEAEQKRIYESLGVKDEAEFQAFLKQKKEAEDAQRTKAEKAENDLKLEQDASAKKDEVITDLQTRLRNTEIKQAASRPVTDKDGKVTRPAVLEAALNSLPVLIDQSLIKDVDGKTTGIDEALNKLFKEQPHNFEPLESGKPQKGTPGISTRKREKTETDETNNNQQADKSFKPRL